jgi:KDO2-lipid IV(A) lauroyltransferase
VLYLALPRRRRIALANLQTAYPELDHLERRRLARRSHQHLGLVVMEVCELVVHPFERFLERVVVEGRGHLDEVMNRHGRALVMSAHLGNWELLPLVLGLTPYPAAIVVRPLDRPGLNLVTRRMRQKTGIDVIEKRGALRALLRALARGTVVGFMADQNATRAESVFVPFFGRPASTSRAMAVLALRTGTPIVPLFTRREGDGCHRVIYQPPIEPSAVSPTGDPVAALTLRCAETIETAIREAPEQWLWIHDRWRTRPSRRP